MGVTPANKELGRGSGEGLGEASYACKQRTGKRKWGGLGGRELRLQTKDWENGGGAGLGGGDEVPAEIVLLGLKI
jgi:hypothetical protein